MPLWFPVIAAGAAAVMVGKALVRHYNGELAYSAVHDPKGVRTVARFASSEPIAVLAAVADELALRLAEAERPLERVADAVRTAARVDVVRLVQLADGSHTLALTRAWTGPQLTARAVELLEQLHAVLAAHPAVTQLSWYARQDRQLADPRPYPFDP